MTEKIKASKKALILTVVLVLVAVVMAVSSYLFPDELAEREMVTDSPRAAAGIDPNHTECVRCAGTDCVIWLPDNLSVTEEKVFGREGDLAFLVLATAENEFTDGLREEVFGGLYEPLTGSKRSTSIAVSETGYLYQEKVAYEEAYVRARVSLRTQKSYVFSYLIKNGGEGCLNTVVAVECEGKGRAEDARDLAMSIAGSYQRFRDQREEVQGAIYEEASHNWSGEEEPSSEAGGDVVEVQPVSDGSLVIDSVISVGRRTKGGDVLVFMWENDFAEPRTLGVTSPSGKELKLRPESGGGFMAFDVDWSEAAEGWHVTGTTDRELGLMIPLLYDAEEYAETFGY